MDVSKCNGSICSYKGHVKQGVALFYIYVLKNDSVHSSTRCITVSVSKEEPG